MPPLRGSTHVTVARSEVTIVTYLAAVLRAPRPVRLFIAGAFAVLVLAVILCVQRDQGKLADIRANLTKSRTEGGILRDCGFE